MSSETEHDEPRTHEEMRRQEAVTEAAYPKVHPPCPPWCCLRAGHRYDSVEWDLVTHLRYHQLNPDGDDANLTQAERNQGGVVRLDSPAISVYGDEAAEITSGDARKRAALLLNLADKLDEITGGKAPENARGAIMRVVTTYNTDVVAAVVLAPEGMTLMVRDGLIPDGLIKILDTELSEAGSYYTVQLHHEPVGQR